MGDICHIELVVNNWKDNERKITQAIYNQCVILKNVHVIQLDQVFFPHLKHLVFFFRIV